MFLSDHGGSSNAYTASDLTNYHFEVAPEHRKRACCYNPCSVAPHPRPNPAPSVSEALDRFAGFFTGPLLKASAVSRELLAVDAEHAKNLQSDMWCVAARAPRGRRCCVTPHTRASAGAFTSWTRALRIPRTLVSAAARCSG